MASSSYLFSHSKYEMHYILEAYIVRDTYFSIQDVKNGIILGSISNYLTNVLITSIYFPTKSIKPGIYLKPVWLCVSIFSTKI